MKTRFYILPLILLAAACQSSAYRSSGARPSIDDATLMSVPVGDRDGLQEARAECSAATDRVALAKQEVETAKQQVTLDEKSVGIARTEIDAAEDRLELARQSDATDRKARIESATKHLHGTRAHLECTRAQVRLGTGRVTLRQAGVAHAEQRVRVADAKVELAKAEAVSELERSDLEPVDVAEFARCVAEEEVGLKMSAIDVDACEKKLELQRDALEACSKAVPSDYRDRGSKKSD